MSILTNLWAGLKGAATGAAGGAAAAWFLPGIGTLAGALVGAAIGGAAAVQSSRTDDEAAAEEAATNDLLQAYLTTGGRSRQQIMEEEFYSLGIMEKIQEGKEESSSWATLAVTAVGGILGSVVLYYGVRWLVRRMAR